ncbi:Arc family DNA-binding protein [uncultured Bradyrhizobium sp.]|uniref:Arc family DNA-binding protein n=1 Tax=Bradyrhizobium sp. TaxID=376 RepID=UPI002632C0A8|nr:Arc family DNA-binding protein [uncultured Bradyrhizobium sp.]
MEEVRLNVRISKGLRDQLEFEAARNYRSLNGQIAYSLRKSVRRDIALRGPDAHKTSD